MPILLQTRHALALVVLMLALTCPAGAAVVSEVRGSGRIGGQFFNTIDETFNARDATARVTLGEAGDDAVAFTTLNGSSGQATVSSHACSGPPDPAPPGSGSAGALSNIRYTEGFTVASDTLPAGTWTTARVRLSAAAAKLASLNNDDNAPSNNEGASTGASVQFSFYGPGTNIANFAGAANAQQIWFNDVFQSASGILAETINVPANTGAGGLNEATINVQVGGPLLISFAASTGSSSQAFTGTTAAAESRICLVWGVTIDDGRCVANSGGREAPSAEAVGPRSALDLLPPPFVPEPTSAACLAAISGTLLLRRRCASR